MALQLIAVSLASSVIPDPEQLDHRAPIPTQEEPVAASRADRLTDLPTLEELLAAHPTRAAAGTRRCSSLAACLRASRSRSSSCDDALSGHVCGTTLCDRW